MRRARKRSLERLSKSFAEIRLVVMFNLQGLQGHRKRTGKRVYNTTNGGRRGGREEEERKGRG